MKLDNHDRPTQRLQRSPDEKVELRALDVHQHNGAGQFVRRQGGQRRRVGRAENFEAVGDAVALRVAANDGAAGLGGLETNGAVEAARCQDARRVVAVGGAYIDEDAARRRCVEDRPQHLLLVDSKQHGGAVRRAPPRIGRQLQTSKRAVSHRRIEAPVEAARQLVLAALDRPLRPARGNRGEQSQRHGRCLLARIAAPTTATQSGFHVSRQRVAAARR